MPHISQREARRLRARVAELESRLSSFNRWWSSDCGGGVLIDEVAINRTEWFILKTANKCGKTVVARPGSDDKMLLYAVRTD